MLSWKLSCNIKFGTVGKAMPDTDIKITDKGEVIMKNECIMKGYYKEEELTRQTIKKGYLHTGDKGTIAVSYTHLRAHETS